MSAVYYMFGVFVISVFWSAISSITRAGASSLAEIASLKLPFIAIPLPTSKDNHQFQNAKYYEKKNCCWIIDQTNFDQLKFENLMLDILKDDDDFIYLLNFLIEENGQNMKSKINRKKLISFRIINIVNEVSDSVKSFE